MRRQWIGRRRIAHIAIVATALTLLPTASAWSTHTTPIPGLTSVEAAPGTTVRLIADVYNPGPKRVHQVELSVFAPEGWQIAPGGDTGVAVLNAGESFTVPFDLAVPADLPLNEVVTVEGAARYELDGVAGEGAMSATITVLEPFSVDPVTLQVPLAAGGWNRAVLRLTNRTGFPLAVDYAVAAPEGVTADPGFGSLTLATGSAEDLDFELQNQTRATGSEPLTVIANSAASEEVGSVELLFSDNLARNPVAAQWPKAFSSSSGFSRPPQRANDGDSNTEWRSAAALLPSLNPIVLGIDFGAPVTVGRVTMVPLSLVSGISIRCCHDPTRYTVELSNDGAAWRTVAEVVRPVSTGLPEVTPFAPEQARYVRLNITLPQDSFLSYVMVAELEARPS